MIAAQPRICDLIPVRPWALLLALTTCLVTVAAVEGLHVYAARQPAWLGGVRLDGLDVGSSRSLATWLSSTLLLLCSVKSLLILNFRRHKLDDYRGRYGIWGWVACFFMFASMDATAGFHRVVQSACITMTGNTMLGGGAIWWIGALSIAVVLLGMRVLIDIRQSRAAVLVMLTAVLAYAVTALLRLGVLRVGNPELRVMLQPAVLLTAHALVLFSLQLFARYVFLDAQGLIADRGHRKPSSKGTPSKSGPSKSGPSKSGPSKSGPSKSEQSSPKPKSGGTRKRAADRKNVDSDQVEQAGPAAKPVAVQRDSDAKSVSEDPEEEELMILEMLEDDSISKTERRRLRKQLRRLDRRAA